LNEGDVEMDKRLPGVPDGYEAVRFGHAEHDDEYIGNHGRVCRWCGKARSYSNHLIVRKLPSTEEEEEDHESARNALKALDAVAISAADIITKPKTARFAGVVSCDTGLHAVWRVHRAAKNLMVKMIEDLEIALNALDANVAQRAKESEYHRMKLEVIRDMATNLIDETKA
jgi:hypothetical protein